MNSNLMTDGVISLDDRPAQEAVRRTNAGLDGIEKKTKTVLDRAGREWEVYGEGVVRVSDRSRNSLDRLLQSMQRQADMAGKSGVEKLIAQRDQLIARWAKEQAAVDAINRSYEKQIDVARKLEREQAAAQQKMAGQNMSAWVQDPFGKLRESSSGLLTAAGPLGGALLGLTAGFGALAAAGWEAANSLGEYGLRVQEAELRTGMTAKEVGQFGFAAKVVGQDLSILERGMRGLTMALNEDSKAGERARETLRRFGVAPEDLKSGVLSTSEALLSISDGLSKMPNVWERNRAAMDLFKKAGIEAIPFMVELSENIRRARELGFGPNEEDVRRFKDYHRQIAEASSLWDRLVRKIKEPIAATVLFTLRWALGGQRSQTSPGVATAGGPDTMSNDEFKSALANAALGELYGGKVPSRYAPTGGGWLKDFEGHRAGALSLLGADEKTWRTSQKGLEELASAAEKTAKTEREAYFALREDRKASAESIHIQRDAWQQAEHAAANYRAQFDAIKDANRGAFVAHPGDMLPQVEKNEPYAVAAAGNTGKVPSLAGRGYSLQVATADIDAMNRGWDAAQDAQMKARMAGANEAWSASDQARERVAKAVVGYEEEIVKLNAVDEYDAALKIYDLRVAAAKTAEEQQIAAIYYLKREAELQAAANRKAQADAEKRFDGLKHSAEGLFDALLARSRNVGSMVAHLFTGMLLAPVKEAFATGVANLMLPVSNLFGGRGSDPIKVSTDVNTVATQQNTAALYALAAGVGASGSGGAAGQVPYAPAPMPTSITSIVGGTGATPGFAGPLGGLGGIFKSGGSWLSGLKDAVYNSGSISTGSGSATTAAGIGGWQGTAAGILTSPLAKAGMLAGGLSLAQAGILGSQRGTWGGIGMSTAGGALIGAQFGGPWGAALGAGVGFLAGLGEKLFGVESPENEAKRLVKQIYGLSINDQTAKQIAALAKQSYGGQVSVAVRSAEVRQLLQLYAESTGQKSLLFLNDPHGVNLVEANSKLSQGAFYNNGTAYTYSSNLPVSGVSAATVPTGNPYAGGVTVMVDPEATVNLWATGTAQGIASNPRAVASSAVNGGLASASRISGAIMTLAPDQVAF
jgi:hypothetical protein